MGFFNKVRRRPTLPGFILVPLARVGLTTLFGMGRGGPHRNSHLNILQLSFEAVPRVYPDVSVGAIACPDEASRAVGVTLISLISHLLIINIINSGHPESPRSLLRG